MWLHENNIGNEFVEEKGVCLKTTLPLMLYGCHQLAACETHVGSCRPDTGASSALEYSSLTSVFMVPTQNVNIVYETTIEVMFNNGV